MMGVRPAHLGGRGHDEVHAKLVVLLHILDQKGKGALLRVQGPVSRVLGKTSSRRSIGMVPACKGGKRTALGRIFAGRQAEFRHARGDLARIITVLYIAQGKRALC